MSYKNDAFRALKSEPMQLKMIIRYIAILIILNLALSNIAPERREEKLPITLRRGSQ
jgi:hypothetical protein